MGRVFLRVFCLTSFAATTLGVSRGCNIFTSISSKDSVTQRIEDIRVAIAQSDWIHACTLARPFKTSGSSEFSDLHTRIADGMMSTVFSDPDFFTCVVGGDCSGTSPVCVMAELNTSAACSNEDCLDVLENCDNILNQSSYASLSASFPGMACSSAYVQCSNLTQYAGSTSASAAAAADLIKCKRALYNARASCPQFVTTFVGGPCNTTFNLAGAPCNADICNVTAGGVCNDVTGGPPNVLSTNYYKDATFLVMSSQDACP